MLLDRSLSRALAPVVFLLITALPQAGSAASTLYVDIDGQGANATTTVGSTVVVTVKASDVPAGSDGNGLFGFGVRVGYDGLLLDASNLEIDSQWTGFGSTDDASGSAGLTANLFGSSMGPSGDEILLGSFEFTALDLGFAVLSLTNFTGPGDNILFDGTILDGVGSGYFGSGSISIIPEPTTGLLLLIGLLSVGCARRSRI